MLTSEQLAERLAQAFQEACVAAYDQDLNQNPQEAWEAYNTASEALDQMPSTPLMEDRRAGLYFLLNALHAELSK